MIVSSALALSLALAAPGDNTRLSGEEGLSRYLTNWTLQDLDVPSNAGPSFVTIVMHQEKMYTLVMAPYSNRSSNFSVIAQRDENRYETIEAPAPTTYRGHVDGFERSAVAGAIRNGQFTAVIDFGDGSPTLAIQPASDFGVAAGSGHVVYFADEVIQGDWNCETVDGPIVSELGASRPLEGIEALQTAEIAYDTDFEFYTSKGSSEPNAILDIEFVHNAMATIYERDTEICYTITKIIIRTTSNDPYTTNDPNGLLTQFQSHWNSSQGAVVRDTAHLMTGRGNGGVIGIAYLSVICNRASAYGVSFTNFTASLAFRAGLTAHELGHNWSAPHCDGANPCYIMCSGIGGCSGNVTLFGPTEKASIIGFKNGRTCLTAGCSGGSGPQCSDIASFKPKCKGTTVKVKIKMTSGNFDGENIALQIRQDVQFLTINGSKAKGSFGPYPVGTFNVSIIDPPNCGTKSVTCSG